MDNKTRKWIRSGVETLIHGLTSAATASLTAWAVDPAAFPFFSKKSCTMFGAGFAANGGLRFLQWWNNNPLPDSDTVPPVPGAPTTVISLNPLAKVTPLPVQAPVEPPKP